MFSLDHAITLFFNSFSGKYPALDIFILFFARWIIFIMGVIFFFLILFSKKKESSNIFKSYIFLNVLSLGMVLVVTNLLFGAFFFRPRPFVDAGSVNIIGSSALDNSFPSVHAMLAFFMAFMAQSINKKVGVWFLIAAGLVALSRVVGGVHYASDVLAGAFFGALGAYAIKRFFLDNFQ